MKHLVPITAAFAFALTPPARALTDAEVMEKGKNIAAEAFAALSQELVKAMAEGGPAKALPVCHEKAAKLAGELGKKHGAEVRRVTHKARNPKNRASEAEMKILDGYAARIAAREAPKPVVVRNEAKQAVFHAPILLVMDTCLKCHGDPAKDIAPKDLALIRSLYPDDAATGFKLNQLRGMWKITFNRE